MDNMRTNSAFELDPGRCATAHVGFRGNVREAIDYGRAQEIVASGGNPLFAMLAAARGSGHAG